MAGIVSWLQLYTYLYKEMEIRIKCPNAAQGKIVWSPPKMRPRFISLISTGIRVDTKFISLI
jgi:hypothetical protein